MSGEQAAERKQHDTEQGRLEGKLTLMSDVMAKSSCASTAQIGDIVKQQLARQIYQRARVPIAEGRLHSLSGELLTELTPKVTNYLRHVKEGWYSEEHNRELIDYESEYHEKDPVERTRKEKQHDAEHRQIEAEYRSRLAQLLSDADALRVALLDKLPPEAQTPDDKNESTTFAKAKSDAATVGYYEACCPESISEVANYLDALASRVARIKGLRA